MCHTVGLSEDDIREPAILVLEECKNKPEDCWPRPLACSTPW